MADSEYDEWKKLIILDNDSVPTNGNSLNLKENSESPLKVLIADDDRIQLRILKNYLESLGYKVYTASSGEEALKIITIEKPNIVITDYHMEPVDGITLCKSLRANDENQWIYVILLTADNDTQILEKAFESGVNDFVTKPFKLKELEARVFGAQRFARMINKRNEEESKIRNYANELVLNSRYLESLSTTDPLTELPNRRYANDRLDQEWNFFHRTKNNFAICSLDLDLFKRFNDTHGHDVGDQVLIHFAHILKKSIRANDVACRIGGEEFIVIAPNTNAECANTLSERIRQMVETHQPDELTLCHPITVSIGCAISSIELDSGWADTLKRSDQALYNAKSSGRNVVKFAH